MNGTTAQSEIMLDPDIMLSEGGTGVPDNDGDDSSVFSDISHHSVTSTVSTGSAKVTVTKRNVALKVELTGDVPHQLEVVARTIFNKDVPAVSKQAAGTAKPPSPSRGLSGLDCEEDKKGEQPVSALNFSQLELAPNSRAWRMTDEVLYAEAKQSYDEILAAFSAQPRVFKIAATREYVWRVNGELAGALPKHPLLPSRPLQELPASVHEALVATRYSAAEWAAWEATQAWEEAERYRLELETAAAEAAEAQAAKELNGGDGDGDVVEEDGDAFDEGVELDYQADGAGVVGAGAEGGGGGGGDLIAMEPQPQPEPFNPEKAFLAATAGAIEWALRFGVVVPPDPASAEQPEATAQTAAQVEGDQRPKHQDKVDAPGSDTDSDAGSDVGSRSSSRRRMRHRRHSRNSLSSSSRSAVSAPQTEEQLARSYINPFVPSRNYKDRAHLGFATRAARLVAEQRQAELHAEAIAAGLEKPTVSKYGSACVLWIDTCEGCAWDQGLVGPMHYLKG